MKNNWINIGMALVVVALMTGLGWFAKSVRDKLRAPRPPVYSEYKSFDVMDDKISVSSGKSGIRLRVNGVQYSVPAAKVRNTMARMVGVMDKEAFKKFPKTPENRQRLRSALLIYRFAAQPDKYAEWCAEHYGLREYPKQFEKYFRKRKSGAAEVIESAYGKRALAELDKIALEGGDYDARTAFLTVTEEYLEMQADYGDDFSKRDFCVWIDDNAGAIIEYNGKWLQGFISNF